MDNFEIVVQYFDAPAGDVMPKAYCLGTVRAWVRPYGKFVDTASYEPFVGFNHNPQF